MIFFLCPLFARTDVDGIYFEEIPTFGNVSNFVGRQRKFNNWLKALLQASTEKMIDEYIRLTNIAFSANCDSPPVFLLDEIQWLASQNTNILSLIIIHTSRFYISN